MAKATVRPAIDLRDNYSDIVKALEKNDHVIITNNGTPESVIIGIKDYAKYEEYLHRNFIYEELQKSKATLNDPNVELHDAEEVFAELDRTLKARGL